MGGAGDKMWGLEIFESLKKGDLKIFLSYQGRFI